MNKIVYLAVLLLALNLTACGGGGGGGGGNSGDAPTPTNNAVAAAGPEQDVTRNDMVTLDGSGSSNPENDSLTYTWTQTYGPDVTNGIGSFSGVSPSFTAPSDVSTVIFELTVSDGSSGTTQADSIQINVLENPALALYVDADNGSDTTGDGSRAKPYASIYYAARSIYICGADIYVKSRSGGLAYDESSALSFDHGTSLYGGYGANWVRDVVNNKTAVNVLVPEAITYFDGLSCIQANPKTWVSGFNLSAVYLAGEDSPHGIRVHTHPSAELYIQDNIITVANAAFQIPCPAAEYQCSLSSGNSYGLNIGTLNKIRILRNTITAGSGAAGQVKELVYVRTVAADGADATGRAGAAGGSFGTYNGGKGGDGGLITYADGAIGSLGGGGGGTGGVGGSSASGNNSGRSGDDGLHGPGGPGGNGAGGAGSVLNSVFINHYGDRGQAGVDGGGGGGGGGGEAGLYSAGGGGGGGGAGGVGAPGNYGGFSGGASIGILLNNSVDTVVDGNTITSTNGGDGANGGSVLLSGIGGGKGRGTRTITDAGWGGDGGMGGSGGDGGAGGGGGGGPSYAILVGGQGTPIIINNTLTSGNGGTVGTGGDGGYSGQGAYAANGQPAEGGYSFGIYVMSPSVINRPDTSNNQYSIGNAGASGQSGDKNF